MRVSILVCLVLAACCFEQTAAGVGDTAKAVGGSLEFIPRTLTKRRIDWGRATDDPSKDESKIGLDLETPDKKLGVGAKLEEKDPDADPGQDKSDPKSDSPPPPPNQPALPPTTNPQNDNIRAATLVALSTKSPYAVINALVLYAQLLEIELKRFPVERGGKIRFEFEIDNPFYTPGDDLENFVDQTAHLGPDDESGPDSTPDPTDILPDPKDVLSETKDILSDPKDVLKDPKGVLSDTKDILDPSKPDPAKDSTDAEPDLTDKVAPVPDHPSPYPVPPYGPPPPINYLPHPIYLPNPGAYGLPAPPPVYQPNPVVYLSKPNNFFVVKKPMAYSKPTNYRMTF